MSYEPQTVRTRWIRDLIISALREHERLNTTQLAKVIGFLPMDCGTTKAWCDACQRNHDGLVKRRVTSAHLQPTMVAMERHDEITRWREHPSDIWVWALGAGAPDAVDVDELERDLLRD